MSRFRSTGRQCEDRNGREARIDPLCHTLVGAALARSGLARRTALGATALVIGANLPDIDALAYFAGPAADLEWRRGWTHGVLALALLPLILTLALLLFHWAVRSPRGRSSTASVSSGQLLFLSGIAIFSHPFLDTLNTYGVRWLMPFSAEWFYGDTLFIIDPWVWLVLSVGVVSSVRRHKKNRRSRGAPAWHALGLVAIYASAMALSSAEARRMVRREITMAFGQPTERAMVGPVPFNPFVREFVVEQGEHYRVGTFRWLPRPRVDRVTSYPRKRPPHPAVSLAAGSPLGRRFLGWARFPTFEVEELAEGRVMVHVVDLRYARAPGDRFGAVSIPITLPELIRK
jgi:inner membrane protein